MQTKNAGNVRPFTHSRVIHTRTHDLIYVESKVLNTTAEYWEHEREELRARAVSEYRTPKNLEHREYLQSRILRLVAVYTPETLPVR